MFTAEDVRERVKQRPFRPLRIVMSGGQTYDIYHPDLIMVGRRELVIGAGSPDTPTYYERLNRLAIMHITALEDLPAPAPASGNGES